MPAILCSNGTLNILPFFLLNRVTGFIMLLHEETAIALFLVMTSMAMCAGGQINLFLISRPVGRTPSANRK